MGADSARIGTAINPVDATLFLPEEIVTEMHSHASLAYPEECCGLLLGVFEGDTVSRRVQESKRMENVFLKEERYHRYSIDPKEFLMVESAGEARGLEVIGIYHSHPNAPAKPSQFDTARAWPNLSYVVMEVRDSKPVETRSWILKDDRSEFASEKISIVK